MILKKYNFSSFLSILIVLVLAGCSNTPPAPRVQQPMSVRPIEKFETSRNSASMFNAKTYRSLFEDSKATRVGDTLTIIIAEKNSASKQSSLNSSKESDLNVGTPTITGGPLNTLRGITRFGIESNDTYSFKGKGDAAINNAFNGNIAVTVIDVLANGNLMVSGEKQVAINHGVEYVRFSGVVNPRMINNNSVQSYLVADAKLEYQQDGVLGDSQAQGWLTKFFMSISPF